MGLRGLYLSSCIYWMISCGSPQVSERDLMLEENNQRFNISGEFLLIDKIPFSGRVYGFYPKSQDTSYVSTYREGMLHGERRYYWENGAPKERRYFNQGEKEGDYEAWWSNGQKQLHYFFKDGEYQGELKEWNPEGFLTRIMNYDNGHESGVQKWWYDSGEIKANYVIKNGRRYGLLGTKNCTNVSDSVFVGG